MIVSLETGRLRCAECAYDWTPATEAWPRNCPACGGCRGCEMRIGGSPHTCRGPTNVERVRDNLEALPAELIDAIRRSAPRG